MKRNVYAPPTTFRRNSVMGYTYADCPLCGARVLEAHFAYDKGRSQVYTGFWSCRQCPYWYEYGECTKRPAVELRADDAPLRRAFVD